MAQESETARKNPLGEAGENVRRNVARLRVAKGLGYAELSRNLSGLGRAIPPLGLTRIEKGERRVDADDLVYLARALSTTVDSLLAPQGTEQVETIVVGEQTAFSEAVEAARDWLQRAFVSSLGVSAALHEHPEAFRILRYVDGTGPRSADDYYPWLIRCLTAEQPVHPWISVEVGREEDVAHVRSLAVALVSHITSGSAAVYDPDDATGKSWALDSDG